MALEYVTTLTVVDASSGAPAALADVVAIVGEWAGVDGLQPDDRETTGRNGARVVTHLLDPGDRDIWAWTLAMDVTNEDRSGELVDWNATVSVIESHTTRAAIRVERIARTELLRPLETRAKPPRLVADLVAAAELRVVDGGLPLRLEPATLTDETIDEFVLGLLLGPNRRLPVIGISQARYGVGGGVNADRIASELIGLGHVWVIPSAVTWKLSEALTPRLSVYNGAARMWWPGFVLADDPYSHPLWLPRPPLRRIEDEIIELVLNTAGTRFAQPEEVRDLEHRARRSADEELRREIDTLLELATKPADSAPQAEERERLEESVRQRLENIEVDRDQALLDIEALEAERDVLRRESAELRSQVYRLRARAGLWEAGEELREELTAEDAFLEEVRYEYESRFTSDDQAQFPLAPLAVGAVFLATLEQLDVSREKVVQVCAEVGSRRARDIPGRQVHALRLSEAGNSPQRLRARDGATAYRCYIEHKTSQAARLHWWAIGDAVEFASVGRHDYVDIPE